MLTEPIISWRISLPLKDLPIGPALTPQLREIEEQIGVTRDVLWAYAHALPQFLAAAIMQDVQPLGFGRGSLVAIATEIPVHLPDVQFVQTASETVCRELGSSVRYFHVKGRACLETLVKYGAGVERVWVRDCPPHDIDAPFEVTFMNIGNEPIRWHERYGLEHFVRLATLDENIWLSWDCDLRRPVIEIDHEIMRGVFGPRDVAPEKHPPPWASPTAFAYGGTGWAATTLLRGDRSVDEVCVSSNRRWLLVHSFPAYPVHDALLEAWRENLPMRSFAEGTSAFAMAVDLELRNDQAHFRWIGTHRLLRLRKGQCEQLTIDHTLQWHYAQQGETLTPEIEAALAQYKNIVTRSLGSHDFDAGTCNVEPGDRFVLLSSSAHEKLLEHAGETLAVRLSESTVQNAARWAANVLRDEDGAVRHPVILIDADAVVTVEHWYDKPISLHCEAGSETEWQLLEGVKTKPWIWPKRWSRGIREQMAQRQLLAAVPKEGDVLVLRKLGGAAFQWRDGAWHDVRADFRTFKQLASGSMTILDRGAIALEKPFSWEERVSVLEAAGFVAEANWLKHQILTGGILSHSFGGWIDMATQKDLLRCSGPCTPSVRDLIEKPGHFDGRRIRTRGILHVRSDAVVFADAPFQCATSFPIGIWLVEVEGEWSCEERPRLIGDARLVSVGEPRPVSPDRVVFARPYVPLVAEILTERDAKGWKFKDRRFISLHRDSPLPKPSEPDTRRVRIVFVRDAFHVFGVVSYTFLDEPTQAAEPVSI